MYIYIFFHSNSQLTHPYCIKYRHEHTGPIDTPPVHLGVWWFAQEHLSISQEVNYGLLELEPATLKSPQTELLLSL